MAGSVFDLFARLLLDTKPFEDGLDDAKGKAESGGSKIGSALATGGKIAGAALAAAGTAVVAFGKSSVDAGMSFDTAMSQVAATSGKSMDELMQSVGEADTAYGKFSGNLRDFAQFLGANTSFSATQAAEALNYMALAGYDAQQSMDMLPTVLDLAAAGGIDLAYASDMVTDAQSALGLSAEETAEMVDKMALTSSKTNTSVSQLGEAILQIGATARSVQGGTTELSTVLGVLADNGIKGAEGGTHLRNIIMSLQSPTKDGAAALEELGVKVYDADGNMRSLVDIVGDMQTGLGDMDQASRDAMINGIFNKTDIASVNALLNTSQERFVTLTATIDDAHGAAQRMASTQLDNLAGDVTLFQSALEGAKIAISDSLTPTLRDFVQFGTEAVSELGTAFREDGLEGALNALGPVIDQGIGLIFDKLPAVLDAAVALLDALVSGIITNLPKLIPAAIQLLERIVTSISDNIDKIIDSAVEIIFALADGLIDALPKLIPAVVKIILKIVEKLTEPDTLLKLVDAAIQIIGAIGKGLIEAIPDLLKSTLVVLEHLVEYIINYLPQLLESGKKLMTTLGEGITEAASSVWDSVKQVGEGIWNSLQELVESAKQWGIDLIQNFIDGILDRASALWDTVTDLAQGLRDFLGFSEPRKGPLSNFHTYAPDMMALFAKGIKENEGLVTAQISKSFNFEPQLRGASPALAAGPTTNTYNITVNGIDELEEVVRWYQGRQVEGRMR